MSSNKQEPRSRGLARTVLSMPELFLDATRCIEENAPPKHGMTSEPVTLTRIQYDALVVLASVGQMLVLELTREISEGT